MTETKYILLVDYDCLPSLTAIEWAKRQRSTIDVCSADIVREFYGTTRLPSLIKVGEYGLIKDYHEGFNEQEYDRILTGLVVSEDSLIYETKENV